MQRFPIAIVTERLEHKGWGPQECVVSQSGGWKAGWAPWLFPGVAAEAAFPWHSLMSLHIVFPLRMSVTAFKILVFIGTTVLPD